MSIFGSIPVRRHKASLFNLSHEVKLTTEMGYLVPIMCQPVIPGDRWQVSNQVMVRLAPMIAPIMHQVNVYVHHFFVPNRILWKGFEDFITGGKDGTLAPALPCLSYQTVGHKFNQKFLSGIGSLWDYLGLPPYNITTASLDGSIKVSLLPFMAYQKIYQDYYIDENLSNENNQIEFPIDEEGDFANVDDTAKTTLAARLLAIHRRAWRKDYFTSALPWPQRGADVTLPMHGDAEVDIQSAVDDPRATVTASGPTQYRDGIDPANIDPSTIGFREGQMYSQQNANQNFVNGVSVVQMNLHKLADGLKGTADLSQVTAATINELRTAIKTQEFLENSARGGARYIENILSHFGVKSSDARLQRAEFLGGGIIPVQIGNVFQSSQTTDDSPQAEFSGTGLAVGRAGSGRRRFEEHGYIMSILSIVPKASYQQGIPRDFLKMDKFEWYWPEFAHLGEQAIYNAELYQWSTDPYGTFGYTPRYAEYKYIPSSVHGDFRDTLKFWHLGRIFESEPALNEQFVTVDNTKNDLKRIWNVTKTEFQHFYVLCNNNVKVSRRMPRYGVPHF